MTTSSRTVIPITFKRIIDDHGRLHLQLARTGAVLPYHRFGYNQMEIKRMGNSYCSFRDGKARVRPESKRSLESGSIFSGRSRSWSRSRFKFVDSAALLPSARCSLAAHHKFIVITPPKPISLRSGSAINSTLDRPGPWASTSMTTDYIQRNHQPQPAGWKRIWHT